MEQERDVPLTVFKPHVQTYAIVYQNTGQYELLGHGFLSILSDEVEDIEVHYLEVESVQDGEVLLRSRLRLLNNFEKQRGSVIVWTDQEQRHHDIAISFESEKECDIIWRLICEKIGKNYLELSGRQTLKMPTENNLPYILEQTKNSKDMVEYNLIHNPPFAAALVNIFQTFKERKDRMGMGMMGRIVKSIFSNIDYRMVQAIFKDPVFHLILEVQKFLQDVNFPQMWIEKLKIRHIVPLNEEITIKIHLIHRINFYKQNILDLKVDGYLENVLVMAQQECSKNIIHYFTKQNIIQDLIKVTYQDVQEKLPEIVNDFGQEDTYHSQSGKIKYLQFGAKKIQFMMEAMIISKQMESQNIKLKFFDKIIKSGFMEMATQYMDKGLLKSFDFFVFFAKLAPLKFVDYLKNKYRENPSDNLHTKLSKKYCLGNEQIQSSILQLIISLGEGIKIKENLDFFMGTFFASVFMNCKEAKPLLNLVSQMQNMLENIETFFTQGIKNKIFEKLVFFLRNQRQEKRSQINAVRILKRVLLQNADSSWSFRKSFLNLLNKQVLRSGYFDYCMTVLQKNIRFNNILSSSMLQNLKIIRDMNRYTVFHKEIQESYNNSENLTRFIQKILQAKEEKNDEDDPFTQERIQRVEQERQEAYLMSEMQDESTSQKRNSLQNLEQLQNLRRMRRQMQQQIKDEQLQRISNPSKKQKLNSEPQNLQIKFDLQFDEQIEEV